MFTMFSILRNPCSVVIEGMAVYTNGGKNISSLAPKFAGITTCDTCPVTTDFEKKPFMKKKPSLTRSYVLIATSHRHHFIIPGIFPPCLTLHRKLFLAFSQFSSINQANKQASKEAGSFNLYL